MNATTYEMVDVELNEFITRSHDLCIRYFFSPTEALSYTTRNNYNMFKLFRDEFALSN